MKFSITIPAYKAEFLKECIQSILAQTFHDFELIIVDDCSPNNLQAIVNQFKDSRIKFFRNNSNCGAINVVNNWNICLSHAQGEYIICMGDDDMLAPKCLEEYNELIKKYPQVNIFHTRVKIIDEKNNFIRLTDPRPEWESSLSMILYRMQYRYQYIGDFLFKTQKLKDLGGFYKLPYAWGSDDITGYLAAEDQGIANLNNPNFYYRINRLTITSTGNNEIKMEALLMTEQWIKNFINNYTIKNEIDIYLKSMIVNGMSKYFFLQKSELIKKDIFQSLWCIPSWYKKRKKYQISVSIIIYAFFEYLKTKYKNTILR